MKSRYDRFLGTLANPKRFAITQLLLREGPLNVGEICEHTGFEQSTVSHHLKRLASCHYVFLKPNGREHSYAINRETIAPLLKLIDRHVSRYCPNCKHAE